MEEKKNLGHNIVTEKRCKKLEAIHQQSLSDVHIRTCIESSSTQVWIQWIYISQRNHNKLLQIIQWTRSIKTWYPYKFQPRDTETSFIHIFVICSLCQWRPLCLYCIFCHLEKKQRSGRRGISQLRWLLQPRVNKMGFSTLIKGVVAEEK